MNRVIAILAGVGLILGIAMFFSAISWRDQCVNQQEGVRGQVLDNKNVYDNHWKTVQEMAQVPAQYKEDFKEVLAAETTGKYGKEGSQATMQWFKDRNINLPETMYLKVMTVIEAGRADFKRGQTLLVDKQTTFRKTLGSFWGSMLAGYWDIPSIVRGDIAPTRDIDGDGRLTVLDYPIVTSGKTNAVFASGEDNEPINVFGKR